MKINNIVKKLTREGYEIRYMKYIYWDVPHVKLKNGAWLAIADIEYRHGSACLNTEFRYNDVEYAILELGVLDIKKLNEWGYCDFSMGDYLYAVRNNYYPWGERRILTNKKRM